MFFSLIKSLIDLIKLLNFFTPFILILDLLILQILANFNLFLHFFFNNISNCPSKIIHDDHFVHALV